MVHPAVPIARIVDVRPAPTASLSVVVTVADAGSQSSPPIR
jgi:hypothetical protein